MKQELKIKDALYKSPESFMELARTVDGFLFDEVIIKQINITPFGREIHYAYRRRNGNAVDVRPLTVTGPEFAQARAKAQEPGSDFSQTSVANKLFADGARQYTEKNKPVEEDALADIEFISGLANPTS